MATDSFRVSTHLPVAPKRLYEAWLNWQEHSAFIGGSDATADPRVGGRHSAWDGYIEGHFLELSPGKRILETWRATDFPAASPPSTLEILFEKDGEGTTLTVAHSEIPKGLGKQYREGWNEHYFTPMKAYFAKLAGKGSASPSPSGPKPIVPRANAVPATRIATGKAKVETSSPSKAKKSSKAAPSAAKGAVDKKARPAAVSGKASAPKKTSPAKIAAKKAAPKKTHPSKPSPKKTASKVTKVVKKTAAKTSKPKAKRR